MQNRQLYGVAFIVCAAMLWGTTGTAQSFATLSTSSYWIGTARLIVAAGFFALWISIADRHTLTRGHLKTLPWRFILTAALSMCAYNLMFFAGVRQAGVALGAALAIGSGPVWAGLIEGLWYRRMPSKAWWLAVAVAVSGLIMASWESFSSPNGLIGSMPNGLALAGPVLCVLSGLAYALYAIVTRQAVSVAPAGALTAMTFTAAAVFAVPVAYVLAGTPAFLVTDIPVMLWLGVVATGVAYLLFSFGLREVSSATAVALALVEPITAVVLAIVIVGEQPGAQGLLGMLIVLIGLVLIVRAERANSL